MRQPRIITLLTDFGNQDAYVGIMKGVISGINPVANIIDICHSIPPQDVFNGAYLLSTAYRYFPKGAIHVAVVDPGVGSERDIVCVEIRDHTFLAPNNGILSFVIQEERPKRIFRVTNSRYFLASPGNTFHGRDIFAPVAAHLSLGVKPQQLGDTSHSLETLDIPQPVQKNQGQLEGRIISIDRFGNLITNFTQAQITRHFSNQTQNGGGRTGIGRLKTDDRRMTTDTLRKTSKNRMVLLCTTMETTLGRKRIIGLSNTYASVPAGTPLVLFGSAGFLEVSVNQGNARQYFKIDRGDVITIGSGRKKLIKTK
ncbi:MAG: hypothetical protein DCC43_08155 [Candidatus Brocadia sp.]|uniref:Adenosyl-chloride synthase n=1 Tax=Candidatus Brocadia fulgida TaxID=380242 RepID=A0A0M2UP27_9BACT|nr:MAG: hypothetical protein BROFUL_03404 [Candidatus Brocadia fulgida]MCC6324090.1 SAM-dependent chlorinase/fluorinase [Candidatus Brocadia sp.]MCE7912315.1 hypothetical protein [Candidatus Brocadia sp. AMX3]MBV6519019.1 Adenosyl-chloride synthase [Candidatus Brocadia fulgida]MDG5996120.1 hypothetical protein [Candidatus Brocadia sp.]